MITPFFAVAIAALSSAAANAQDPAGILTGVEKTAHFEIRFRPGSRAEASVDRVAVVAEKDLEKILAELALPAFPHVIRLFLYDDVEELQRITKSQSAGYSIPLESHVPHDNDQTRLHELVHVVAEKLPEKGPESRNLFMAEGLANAVLRFVNGVHVDAVAAFYKKKGRLPPLSEMLGVKDFYEWLRNHPGFNGYDVGGSFNRYLLDAYGPMKTRKYYCGVPAKEAFGADLAALEKGWHARLDKVVLRPGLQSLLEDRDDPVGALKRSADAKLGPAVLGSASEWRPLDDVLLSGEKNQGDWCIAALPGEPFGDAIVKCRAEALDGCFGVQIQLGPGCQAMVLRGQGAFLYRDATCVAHHPEPTLAGKPVEIVLRRRGSRASAWVDGMLVAEGDVAKGPSVLGVGCVGGKARITGLAARRL